MPVRTAEHSRQLPDPDPPAAIFLYVFSGANGRFVQIGAGMIRSKLRPADQTRPIPGLLRFRRCFEKGTVFKLGHFAMADGPAVNSGG